MSSACNFIASNVLEATTHFKAKISMENQIKQKIMQIPLINNGVRFIYAQVKPLISKNTSDNSQDKKRMWPESNIRDFNPEILNLQPGELVQIRSKEEIFATLDENGKYKGLLFMREMVKFCGQKHKVFKNVKKIQLESTLEMRELKSPTVFLEGVFCDGEFHDGCDRACFLYWKEAWLKRVNK